MAGIDIADRVATESFLQTAPVSWAQPLQPPMARRRQTVRIAKYLLPLVAVALLASIAIWPEMSRNLASGRVTWRRLAAIDPDAGQMLRPRYHGMDERQRPYTVSADSARRAGPERLNLAAPVGDLTLQNGSWLMLRARTGVFMQHAN
jgi:lipopolysaccharide export system protein LptC